MSNDNVHEFLPIRKKRLSEDLITPRTKEGEYLLLLAQPRAKNVYGKKENETFLTLLETEKSKKRIGVFFPGSIPSFLCQENPRPRIRYSATRSVYRKSDCAEQKRWLCIEKHRIEILTGYFSGGILLGECEQDSMEELPPVQFVSFIPLPFDE